MIQPKLRSCVTVLFALAAGLTLRTQGLSQTDPLPSWNDGPAKQAILQFVKATTDKSGGKFVSPAERIVTFDQDGTLWVEHPMYSQVVYCLSRVPAVVKVKPELAQVEPFTTVLSSDREAMARLSKDDLFKILAATLTGMSVEEFRADAKKWLATAKDPRWNRPYTGLTYLPMQELLEYLRTNGYKTYIVTAGGTTYGYDKNGKPFLSWYSLLTRSRGFGGGVLSKPMTVHDGVWYITKRPWES